MDTTEARTSLAASDSGGPVYDAFLSYSHDTDSLLAPRLQSGIQRFAKPWWRRQALRVFRDESSLSANPHLWSSITEAMDDSGWMVLLLSPDAARSEWVNREVEYWLEHKSASRIIPVLTAGDFTWFDEDFISDAAPPALAGAFGEEPRWVDLRFAHTEEQLDLRNALFRDAVADVASAVRGVAKDELESEEIRQHRRTVRTAWLAGIVIALFAVVAVAAALFALDQRNVAQDQQAIAEAAATAEAEQRSEADRQRLAAEESALLARARELAASAISVLDDDPELSVLLALLAANQADPTFESVAALHEASLAYRTLLALPVLDGSVLSAGSLSPDGGLLAHVGQTNLLEMRSADTGESLWKKELAPGLRFDFVWFSPDGSRLAAVARWDSSTRAAGEVPEERPAGVREGLYVFDSVSGDEIETDLGWPCPVQVLLPDGNGRVDFNQPLTAVADGVAAVGGQSGCDAEAAAVVSLNLDTGTADVIVDGYPTGIIIYGSVAADSRYVALNTDARVFVIDTVTGEEIFSAPGAWQIASLNGAGTRIVTGGNGGPPELWDVDSGERLHVLRGHEGVFVFWAYFGADDTVVATIGDDGTVRLWDVDSGEELLVLRGHDGFIWDMGISADATRLASFSVDGARLWNIAGDGELGAVELPLDGWGHAADSLSLAGGRGVAYPGEGDRPLAVIFDVATGAIERTIDNLDGQMPALSPDGRRLAAQHQPTPDIIGTVRIWDLGSGEVLVDMDGLCSYPSPFAAGAGPECADLPAFPFAEWVTYMEFSPDGSRLAIGGFSNSVTVWDAATGTVEFNTGPLTATDRGTAAGTEERPNVAFSPTGDLLAIADTKDILVVETATWTEVARRSVEARAFPMRFTPDGRRLVAADQSASIVVYDTTTWRPTVRIDNTHEGTIKDLEVSRDALLIVSGGSDGIVRVWDIETGKQLQAIPFHETIQNIEFLEERHLLVTSLTGSVLHVTIDVDELVALARIRVTRTFTQGECDTYRIDPCPTLQDIKTGSA